MKKLILLFSLISFQSFAATLTFKEAEGKTSFLSVGRPAMIKIVGEGPGPQGTLESKDGKISGTLTVDLKKLTTKIDLRDDHMKNKYLEVDKYPNAEIIFKDYPFDINAKGEKSFDADFKLHGVTKKISGKIDLSTKKATFTIKVMDYLDTLPSHLGIQVADDVQVTVDLK